MTTLQHQIMRIALRAVLKQPGSTASDVVQVVPVRNRFNRAMAKHHHIGFTLGSGLIRFALRQLRDDGHIRQDEEGRYFAVDINEPPERVGHRAPAMAHV